MRKPDLPKNRNVTLVETWTQGEDSFYGTETKTGKTFKNLTQAQALKKIKDNPRKNYDIYVGGERVMLWSGAGRPFRVEYSPEMESKQTQAPKPKPKKTAPITAEYRKKAWDAKERGQWAKAAKYYALALKHYPPHHPGSQMAIADKAGLQRLLDEMQWEAQTAATPKPPAGSGLQMQSSFEGGGGQTHFAGGSPKRKGKKAAVKTPKRKEKKGSGSLAAFGVMPEGQKTLDEMAAEMMR